MIPLLRRRADRGQRIRRSGLPAITFDTALAPARLVAFQRDDLHRSQELLQPLVSVLFNISASTAETDAGGIPSAERSFPKTGKADARAG